MRALSEGAISSIVCALLKYRRDLSESIIFWRTRAADIRPGFDPMPVLEGELQDNSTALIELAEGQAPWVKQHKHWPLISNNLPVPSTSKDL